jgi:hypothetical protein
VEGPSIFELYSTGQIKSFEEVEELRSGYFNGLEKVPYLDYEDLKSVIRRLIRR